MVNVETATPVNENFIPYLTPNNVSSAAFDGVGTPRVVEC